VRNVAERGQWIRLATVEHPWRHRLVHPGRVTHPFWPLLDLRITTRDLVLTPLTEGDLAEVVRALPDDVEQDPRATTYGLDDRTQRGVVVHQEYWRSYGTWTPQAWRFHLAVRRGDRLVGLQELQGDDFPTLRTVDTSSWLVPDERGAGVGKAMRRAVLALAFGPMEALAAVTSAWHDNHASLGVSRSVGYLPNGESLLARDGGGDTRLHLRLTRDDWLAGKAVGPADPVEIDGFDPCRPFFGLPAAANG
jgi:RimJ/RimL family protein N-acetyltransferase